MIISRWAADAISSSPRRIRKAILGRTRLATPILIVEEGRLAGFEILGRNALNRFLARARSMLRVRLSASAKKKLEQLSRATGVDIDELPQRWVEQGIAREAG